MMIFSIFLSFIFFAGIHTVIGNTSLNKTDFRYASYYADSMVLQGAPKRAVIWGYGSPGAKVEMSVNNRDTYITRVNNDTGKWMTTIGPYKASKPGEVNTIKAIQNSNNMSFEISLQDVLFGDVWLCSGQSNMEFGMSFVYNSSVEIQNALSYTQIRLLHVNRSSSDVPLQDVRSYLTMWSKPSVNAFNTTVGYGGFSALCMLYGMRLYDQLQIPLGLIQSAYGGSIAEAWTSPAIISQCPIPESILQWSFPPSMWYNPPSTLWNAMITPLLNMTIKGAIWYQGESNAWYSPDAYKCVFSKMIEDWRNHWYQSSNGTTDKQFQFGFVQIAGMYPHPYDQWPEIRWHQTADNGAVPNEMMPKTFMAVATDLNDPLSIYNSAHPRDKQTVADRLTWAALNTVYNKSEYPTNGPQVVKSYFNGTDILYLQYDQKITLRSNDIFSFNCTSGGWQDALVTQVSSSEVALLLPQHCAYYHFAYLWKQTPCIYKLCSIYANDEFELPAPTWLWTFETLQNPQNDTPTSGQTSWVHQSNNIFIHYIPFLTTLLIILHGIVV